MYLYRMISLKLIEEAVKEIESQDPQRYIIEQRNEVYKTLMSLV